MAKVIRATPTLVGEEALVFLEDMKHRDNVSASRADKKLLQIIKTHSKEFKI